MSQKKPTIETNNLITSNKIRNHWIDFLRGICILGVIWHHTCLYSGNYVPEMIKQLSFLLEVPALFFVSGLTYQYINRDIIASNFIKLSFNFTLIALILNGLYGNITLPSILNPLFLVGFNIPNQFYVLAGSYWFVPIYAIVLVVATIITKKLHNLYPLILIACFSIYFLPHEVFPLNTFSICYAYGWTSGIFFLLGFFLFGYLYMEQPILQKHKYFLAFIVFLLGVLVYSYCYLKIGYDVFFLWHYKDLKALPYISASFLSISCLIACYKSNLHNRFIEHIGKYSIFYYIGQGISGSYLRSMEPYLNIDWHIKLIVLFTINIILCTICSEIYRKIYNSIGILYQKTTSKITKG